MIAVFCAQNGAKVVATDVNPDAVKNAQINADKHKLNISVREGDTYDPIAAGEKFDFIFWAHPFNAWDMQVDDMLLRSGIDPRYESLQKYIAGAKNRLAQGGKLLLGTGDSADLQLIADMAKQNDYELKLLKESTRPLEPGTDNKIIDLIYEFVPLVV